MELHHFNPENTIEKDSFVWRYMDFEKTFDFISNKELYFARLDTFEDPIEGLPLIYRANLQKRHVHNCELPIQDFEYLEANSDKLKKEQVEDFQLGAYSSCWYLTETISTPNSFDSHHESLAMWNYFKTTESFVVKVNLQYLIKWIEGSLKEFKDPEVFDAKYGKVHYLNYSEYYNMVMSTDKLFMPSLIKHNSYRFENELRFILLRNKPIPGSIDRKGIKLKLNWDSTTIGRQIEIIANPKMNPENFKYYRSLFEGMLVPFKVSAILARDSVQTLLK